MPRRGSVIKPKSDRRREKHFGPIIPLRAIEVPDEYKFLLSAERDVLENSLTVPQFRFVQEYLIDLNATRAYIEVYNAAPENAATAANRLLKTPKIQAAIVGALNSLGERLSIKKAALNSLLWDIMTDPNEKTQHRLRAIEDYAKMNGLMEEEDDDKTKKVPSVYVHIEGDNITVHEGGPKSEKPRGMKTISPEGQDLDNEEDGSKVPMIEVLPFDDE